MVQHTLVLHSFLLPDSRWVLIPLSVLEIGFGEVLLLSPFSVWVGFCGSLESSVSVFLIGWIACVYYPWSRASVPGCFGGGGWCWHQACWDKAVRPRILNVSWPWALRRHLSTAAATLLSTLPPLLAAFLPTGWVSNFPGW